jgi:hypothetical protein
MPFSTLAQENEAAHGLAREMGAISDRYKKGIVLYLEASAFYLSRWLGGLMSQSAIGAGETNTLSDVSLGLLFISSDPVRDRNTHN